MRKRQITETRRTEEPWHSGRGREAVNQAGRWRKKQHRSSCQAAGQPLLSRQAVTRVGESLISLLYPRHCPVCHDIVLPKGAWICPGCQARVPYVEEPVCLRCGKPIAAKEMEYCYDCSRRRRLFVRGFALTVYDEVMRESIRYYKNRGRMEYADWYAGQIWDRYGTQLKQIHLQAIVPVPLHPSRLAERGYNQAEWIAKKLGVRMEIPVLSHGLRRRQKTTAQKFLGAGERSHNLESVFAPGRQSVAGLTVLLVDDIYTTGATAENCTEVLLAAGATAVYLVNVCIGEEEG